MALKKKSLSVFPDFTAAGFWIAVPKQRAYLFCDRLLPVTYSYSLVGVSRRLRNRHIRTQVATSCVSVGIVNRKGQILKATASPATASYNNSVHVFPPIG